jgi:hypothetical protein
MGAKVEKRVSGHRFHVSENYSPALSTQIEIVITIEQVFAFLIRPPSPFSISLVHAPAFNISRV